jgi:hypothetical protein
VTACPEPQTKLNHPTPVDQHYEHLRVSVYRAGAGSITIDNLFFILSDKDLKPAGWACGLKVA